MARLKALGSLARKTWRDEALDDMFAAPRGLAPIAAEGDLDPRSTAETRVNTTTGNVQQDAVVTTLTNGNYAIAWTSNGQDGSGYGVYVRRYDIAGNPLGGEVEVNTATAGAQQLPSISALEDDGFIVAWTGVDANGMGVFAQRFDAAGAPAGGEIAVNSLTAGNQDHAVVSGLGNGGFIVVWESADAGGSGIHARLYGSTGAALTPQFPVNTTGAGDQTLPAVAATTTGFVIAWTSAGQDGSGTGVYARTYSASGVASAEFRVNTETANAQEYSSVFGLLGGGFVVVWESVNQDGGARGIYAQRYNSAGAKVGVEFLVNQTTANDQESASVSGLANGGFAIAWTSTLQDGSGTGVYARSFTADGVGGDERLVNATTAGAQQTGVEVRQAVAGLLDGSLIVTWAGRGVGDTSGVFQRRFDPADSVVGGAGADTLEGLGGNDTLQGNAGGDTLDGGIGSDWADYSDGPRVNADLQIPSSNTGEATGDVYVSIENLRGGDLADNLRGDGEDNRIEGGGRNDTLSGRAGDDTLVGGEGFDQLAGQQGRDSVLLTSVDPADYDRIVGFAADETILLDGDAFGLPPGALNPDAFVLGNAAQDAQDRLIYLESVGKLFFDPDGAGGAGRELIAIIENRPELDASHFIVI